MPLGTGTEVGLGPDDIVSGDIVLDGDSAPPPKRAQPSPNFRHVYCDQTAEWIKMPLCTKVGLGPGHNALDGDELPPPKKGAQQPLNFRLDASRCHLVRR